MKMAKSSNKIPSVMPIGGSGPAAEGMFQKYGEESRMYRRTVYTHDDWVRHRSSDRFARNLQSFATSGIYRTIFKEVISVTGIASFVIVWNMLFGEYQDLLSVVHPGVLHGIFPNIPILALPLTVFTISSPSLGLLLVFRTNTSYKRWDEARKNWGMNINHTRDLVRLGNAYYDRGAVTPERTKEDLDRLALTTWTFVRCMKRHLSPEWEDEVPFRFELLEKLPKEQANAIFDSAHRPNRALQDLSSAIENLPMNFIRRNDIQAAATIFEDNLGSSERLLSSPIPLIYSKWTARFLSAWVLFLPFGLWSQMQSWNHIMLLPVMVMLSIFLFGIEELATQLEEPFTILPMQGFCDKIYNWVNEIVTFEPGDNGMPVYYYDNYSLDMNMAKEVDVEYHDLEYNLVNVLAPAVVAAMKPTEVALRWAWEEVRTITKTNREMVWFSSESEMETTSSTAKSAPQSLQVAVSTTINDSDDSEPPQVDTQISVESSAPVVSIQPVPIFDTEADVSIQPIPIFDSIEADNSIQPVPIFDSTTPDVSPQLVPIFDSTTPDVSPQLVPIFDSATPAMSQRPVPTLESTTPDFSPQLVPIFESSAPKSRLQPLAVFESAAPSVPLQPVPIFESEASEDIHAVAIIDIALTPGPLGLAIAEISGIRVEGINPGSQCAGQVEIGDHILEYDGVAATSLSLIEFTEIIKETAEKSKIMKIQRL
jgi:predicted membrane chloride channel (bestrophin family)